jgi:hypothetical protein
MAWIEILAAEKVSDGAGGWLKPGARVECTEAQAASLQANGYAVSVDGPRAPPPPVPDPGDDQPLPGEEPGATEEPAAAETDEASPPPRRAPRKAAR